jgi:23S rRNA (uridine2552-2'-O)-methyltransferase
MAPNTSGNRFADHVQQIELATQASEIALAILAPGGTFVAKVFEGADARGFVEGLRDGFTAVKRLKPKATRTESVEFFVVATGRRG